jgi:hypothetical protein
MIAFLLKTLTTHVLGDFVFQPDHWIKDKQLKKINYKNSELSLYHSSYYALI